MNSHWPSPLRRADFRRRSGDEPRIPAGCGRGCAGQIYWNRSRKKLEFILNLKVNSNDCRISSSRTFAHAVRYYREVFARRMLRESTFSVADGHLKCHLETDWNDVPVEHIDIDAVNEWIWKKREEGLSWVTIKNVLRAMQRVLSCSSKDKSHLSLRRVWQFPSETNCR